MADIYDSDKRSEIMKKVKNKNTEPELVCSQTANKTWI